ncbi:MAG TPA: 16S rRNA (guanine(527)-N(7))-methyltransferase RsmG [Acidobacteriaceae bacterium]
MAITAEQIEAAAVRWELSETLSRTDDAAEKLAAYGNLLLHWNARLSLTSIRDETQVVERHLMEGIFAAEHHPVGATALDFGSGTGIPGIPIAICRHNLVVTLAESHRKKAAFLQEVVRTLGLSASVQAVRAETLPSGSFDAVWMRAVDKSATMLPAAAALVANAGSLCLLGTGMIPPISPWQWKTHPLPGSTGRVLHIGQRA